MSTKPKAKKYRLARQTVNPTSAPDDQTDAASHPPQSNITDGTTVKTGGNIEELTPRQLRIARRIAQKHGLEPETDQDAVRMLREKGIDPFQNTRIVELATIKKSGVQSKGDNIQLPQKRDQNTDLSPSKEVISSEKRESAIRKIQRDIARRRRIKLGLLLVRLAIFVFLPTLIAGFYFYVVATPMYATKSEFLILNAEGGGTSGGGFGGLIPSQFATGQDSTATQSYLESKDAMLRLDKDLNFRDHFSGDNIDAIQRLPEDATNEQAYKTYKRYVKLGYDQTEGVIRMEVSSADPELSLKFSQALITYAEERIDELSQKKREDAVKTASDSLEDAKKERREAQARLVTLQEQSILDPEGEIGNIRALISSVEQQLQEKDLALKAQRNNARPNKARVEALESEVVILSAELEKQNSRLNQAQSGAESLAAQTAEIRMAESDVATADAILQSALEAKRQSEIEASRQVRYLTVSVQPLASQDPSYPKAFEDTLLAFLIFAGIYLMLSLTVSILKEQVSS